MRTLMLVSGVLIASASVIAAAQRGAKTATPSQSCALLTAADITAAVGGPAGEPHDMNLPLGKGSPAGASAPGCMWGPTEGQGMITYSVYPMPPGAQKEEALAKLRQVTETLKSRGWKEDKKAFGSTSCSLLTPPASEKNAPLTTGCLTEAKGMAISMSYLGKKSVPLENLKALLDKLVTRLP